MDDRKTSDTLHLDLLRRIAEQDSTAVAALYDQIAGLLFSTANGLLRDTHDSEEILQDVFVQIWKKARDFNPARGTPLQWTLAILRHRCIDRLRSRQRRHQFLEEMTAEAASTEGDGIRPSENLLGAGEVIAVHDAVQTLPEDQRAAIELAFFRGLSHGEIAQTLCEPLGTIKARIRRGMMKLRENLKHLL